MNSSETNIIKHLFALRFIETRKCNKCKIELVVRSRRRSATSQHTFLSLRCSSCGSFQSLYSCTLLSASKKPIVEVVEMVRFWSAEVTIAKACSLLAMLNIEVTRQTIGKLWRSQRNVCSLRLDKDNIKLGGDGEIVEIDESLFARVKHYKGKDLRRKQIWVFGLVERRTSKVYFQIVPDRSAETLLAIINDHVMPGTLIMSDCWAAYNNISELHKQQIRHLTVNHSVHFVCPKTMACTNLIESLWNSAKMKFKDMRGCNRLYIQSYVDEFMWRHNFKIKREDAINQIFIDAGTVYRRLSELKIEEELLRINGPDEDIGEDIMASDIEDELDDIEEQEPDFGAIKFSHEGHHPEIDALFEISLRASNEPRTTEPEPRTTEPEPLTTEPEPLTTEPEPLSIPHNTHSELVSAFESLIIQKHGYFHMNLIGLNKAKRRLIHQKCEELNLYHWSTQIDEINSDFHVSNMSNYRVQYEKAKRQFHKKQKTVEDRLEELNKSLAVMGVCDSRALCLTAEKLALTPTTSSAATNQKRVSLKM